MRAAPLRRAATAASCRTALLVVLMQALVQAEEPSWTSPPPPSGPIAAHAVGAEYKPDDGSAIIATNIAWLNQGRCDWRIPLASDGAAATCSGDLALCFPCPEERGACRGFTKPLVDRFGFTALSVDFVNPDGSSPQADCAAYYSPEGGVGDFWHSGLSQLTSRVPTVHGKLFLFGRSGGGSAANAWCAAYPREVAALVSEAAQHCPDHNLPAGIPVLLTHGEFDHTAADVTAAEAVWRKAGALVTRLTFRPNWDMRGTTPVWTHGVYDAVRSELYWQWLADVADLYRANHGTCPAMSRWYVHNGMTFPGRRSFELSRRWAPPVIEVSDPSGAAVIARAAPATSVRGLVLLASDRFVEAHDVLSFDAQQVSDAGFLAIAASALPGEGPRSVALAFAKCTKGETELPVTIAAYGADSISLDLVKPVAERLNGIILFDIPVNALARVLDPLAAFKVPITIMAYPTKLDAIQSACAGRDHVDVQVLSHEDYNLSQDHGMRSDSIARSAGEKSRMSWRDLDEQGRIITAAGDLSAATRLLVLVADEASASPAAYAALRKAAPPDLQVVAASAGALPEVLGRANQSDVILACGADTDPLADPAVISKVRGIIVVATGTRPKLNIAAAASLRVGLVASEDGQHQLARLLHAEPSAVITVRGGSHLHITDEAVLQAIVAAAGAIASGTAPPANR